MSDTRFQKCSYPDCPQCRETCCVPGGGDTVTDVIKLVLREPYKHICRARIFEHLEFAEPTAKELEELENEFEDVECIYDAEGCKGCEEYSHCKELQQVFEELPGSVM